jgi:RNA recognition motif-containing protein
VTSVLERINELQAEPATAGNAKARRRISHFVTLLEDSSGDGSGSGSGNGTRNEEEKDSKKKKQTNKKPLTEQEIAAEAQRRAEETTGFGPCIAFVGQLTLNTTAQELETYLRDKGSEGPINIRLMTERGSKKSKEYKQGKQTTYRIQ